MVAMRVMQVAIDQIVHVITVRHCRMTTARSVDMIHRVGSTGMLRRARRRIGRGDGDQVLIDMVSVRMMEMTIVEVVDVSFMPDGHVTAFGAMLMVVVFV